jgi:hypothetical protein
LAKKATLRFRADGRLLIAQFTDLHLSDGRPADQQTLALMAEVLDAEKPDLAVLTGDIIAGVGNPTEDSTAAWKMAVEPLESRGIPWAAAYGNHDEEGSLGRAELMKVQMGFPHCLTQPGPSELPGMGNYVVEVLASRSDSPAARLFFLDTLTKGHPFVGGYPWVSLEQIIWYRRVAFERPQLPGLAFMHIPLPEYDEVWRTRPCYGHKFEDVCCPKLNSGLFTAMLESGAVQGVFAGHDHINDYDGDLHGIRLVYGRAGGFNTYGKERFPRGARLIRLAEGVKGFGSWLRLENGIKVVEQALHHPEFPVKKD